MTRKGVVWMVLMLIFAGVLGILSPDGLQTDGGCLSFLAPAAHADEGEAADSTPPPESVNWFMRGGIFLGGIILIWLLFYKMLYHYLLNFFWPDYSETLIWSLLLLYLLAWFAAGAYALFGFAIGLGWFKWVFAFLAALWLIWFVVAMVRGGERNA